MAIMLAMKEKVLPFLSMATLLVLLQLAGCAPETTETPGAPWTPLPLASSAPIPTATPTFVPITGAQSPQNCVNDAIFLEDLTLPDQTVVDPGATLDKRWSVQNSGTCDWGPGYLLMRVSIDAFGGDEELGLYPARAGASAVWKVELVAPTQPGEYISIWQARAPDGNFFGEQVFLWVIVEPPDATPTSRGTPTN